MQKIRKPSWQDSKNTSAIDISITGSCGSVAGSAGDRGLAVLTELLVSLLALLVSPPPLFASFKILSFNLFM